MTNEKLQGLAARAAEVGSSFERNQAAAAQAHLAEAELLQDVEAAVLPALRAIGTRPVLRQTTSASGTTVDARAPWLGVHVARERENREQHAPAGLACAGPHKAFDGEIAAERGDYEGRDLFLGVDDGLPQLWEVSYSGRWSTVEGEISRWKGEPAAIATIDAVKRYGVTDIVHSLSKALDAASTKRREDRTNMLHERAERLRALATLVRASL